MGRFPRWLGVLGVNAVPAGGVAWGSWDGPTALTVYWLESVFAVLLVAVRIEAHRRLTGKRGHYASEALVVVRRGGTQRRRTVRSFLLEFLTSTVVVQALAALAVLAALDRVFHAAPDRATLTVGLAGVLAFQGVGLVADLPGLSRKPFQWIRYTAMNSLGRAAWLMLAVVVGWAWSSHRHEVAAFVLPFAALRLAGDVSLFLRLRGLEDRVYTARPPGCLTAFMRLVGKGEGFEEYWAAEHAQHHRGAAADEETLNGPPPPDLEDSAPPSRRRRR